MRSKRRWGAATAAERGPVVGTIGTLQALLALHLLTGKPVAPRLRLFDGRTLSWREMAFRKDPACPVCGRSRT